MNSANFSHRAPPLARVAMEALIFQRPPAQAIPASLMLQAPELVTAPALQLARVVSRHFHEAPGGDLGFESVVLNVNGTDQHGGTGGHNVGVVDLPAARAQGFRGDALRCLGLVGHRQAPGLKTI